MLNPAVSVKNGGVDVTANYSITLFSNNVGVITASPISYSVDSRQYVAIISSSNVFAFGLPDGGAK